MLISDSWTCHFRAFSKLSKTVFFFRFYPPPPLLSLSFFLHSHLYEQITAETGFTLVFTPLFERKCLRISSLSERGCIIEQHRVLQGSSLNAAAEGARGPTSAVLWSNQELTTPHLHTHQGPSSDTKVAASQSAATCQKPQCRRAF